MSMTFAQYISSMQTMMATNNLDTDFTSVQDRMIEYAELRIYRELDLLFTILRDTSTMLVANSRNLTLPTSIVIMQSINVITPAGAPSADAGTRNPLVPVTRDVIDSLYPSIAVTGVPSMFAMINNSSIIVGQPPDSNYQVEVIGTQRPAPLSSTNTTTFLTLNLPDLFLAASMVWAMGYQRDFGAQTDDPKSSVSWESQYQTLFASANTEELRRKFQSSAWTSQQPTQLASPPRS